MPPLGLCFTNDFLFLTFARLIRQSMHGHCHSNQFCSVKRLHSLCWHFTTVGKIAKPTPIVMIEVAGLTRSRFRPSRPIRCYVRSLTQLPIKKTGLLAAAACSQNTCVSLRMLTCLPRPITLNYRLYLTHTSYGAELC